MGIRFTQENHPVWGVAPANYNGSASTGDYISMKNYGHCAVVIQTGAWQGGAVAVTLSQATTVAGAGDKSLAFTAYQHTTGLTVDTPITVASGTCSITTANKLYIIEVDAADLDQEGGFDCLRVNIGTPSSNDDVYGVMYFLSDPRYTNETSITD